MEEKKNRKKLSPNEKEEWLKQADDLQDWDTTVPEYGYRKGHPIIQEKPEEVDIDEGFDRWGRPIVYRVMRDPYPTRTFFSKACGIEHELMLKKRFDELPLTAKSVFKEPHTPQMKLYPIQRINGERLLTFNTMRTNVKRLFFETDYSVEDAEKKEVDLVKCEYDFFPAGMTLNLALESCLKELQLDIDSIQAEFDFNLEIDSEESAINVVVNILEGMQRHGARPRADALIAAIESLRPFVYSTNKASGPGLITAYNAILGQRDMSYGSIFTRFDAIYYSLVFFAERTIKKCQYCGRYFFVEHGKDKYCPFNCPDADGLTCHDGGVKKMRDKDRDAYAPEIERMKRNIASRFRSKKLYYPDVSKIEDLFYEEYHAKRDELFDKANTGRTETWKKHQYLYEWLVEYNKRLAKEWEGAKKWTW